MADDNERKRILKKLEKIKALAEQGVGGEKESAKRIYQKLCEKYEISAKEEQGAFGNLEIRSFSYETELEDELLRQIFYKVTGSSNCFEYTGPYKGRKERGCECTEFEALEIQLLFDFYREKLKEELYIFMLAFMNKNHIHPNETARVQDWKKRKSVKEEYSEEELGKFAKAAMMMGGMADDMPPRAEIEGQ